MNNIFNRVCNRKVETATNRTTNMASAPHFSLYNPPSQTE